eukprot:10187372-Ditylum_brightwellii.AAC.1
MAAGYLQISTDHSKDTTATSSWDTSSHSDTAANTSSVLASSLSKWSNDYRCTPTNRSFNN